MEKAKLPATLQRYADKIMDIDRDQDGWSIGLNYGWFCEDTETHQIYENTLNEIARRFRWGSVVPCRCEDCLKHLREDQ